MFACMYLGMVGLSDTQLKSLHSENTTHGDIIPGDYNETYANLTRKALTFYRWFATHGAQSGYSLVVKSDDDVWVNFTVLESTVTELIAHNQTQQHIWCQKLLPRNQVLRDGKYGVSKQEAPFARYPPFCQGYLYVANPAFVIAADTECQKQPFFRLDDPFLGMCVRDRLPEANMSQLGHALGIHVYKQCNSAKNIPTQLLRFC